MTAYLFDTYALYEIAVGNNNYQKFTKNVRIYATQQNLMELYYQLLLTYNKQTAMHFYKRYEEHMLPVTDETVFEAMDFRLRHKKKKLSYVDCIGYALAKRLKIPFLTGDQGFKDLENVEFVK